ncbi:MAG: hypothetical protein JXR78_10105 [Victivallales bacterium]|nr:hypothetical protein [Victivallales bacterium]
MNKELIFCYRSFWPEFEAMKQFREAGVNIVCVFPANTDNSLGMPYSKYPPVWRWFDKYDFDSLNKQFDDVLAVNPDAEFICMVDLNTPSWLQRQMSSRGHSVECESFSMLSCACANPEWRKFTGEYLKTIVKHMEARYGDRIKAYLMACGKTDEWMDCSKGIAGREKTAAWNEWLKQHGSHKTPVPALEHIDLADFENLIRNPQDEQDIIDYTHFSGDVIVDAVLEFAAETRALIPAQRQIGMFFGYILELTGTCAGHLEYERLYASDDIDFFISPGTYRDRPMGGGSGFMVPYGTLKRNGKKFLHEIDHRTHTYNCDLDEYVSIGWMVPWKDQTETDAGLKREFALATINQTSLWCFDMWGGVFITSETMKLVEKSREIWETYTKEPLKSVAEVALVVDPQSARLLNDKNPVCSKIYAETRNKLNRLGAPFDVLSVNDLAAVDISQYKLLVMPGLFELTPEKETMLKKYVFNSSRTVLFAYATGICDGTKLDVNNIEKLTGTKFKTPGLSMRKHDNWLSAYVPDYDTLTPAILKQLASEAGVTIYCQEEIPVYANERLVAIHTAEGGRKTISLPCACDFVTELHTKLKITVEDKCFTYEFKSPDTAVFQLQKQNHVLNKRK